MSETTTTPNYGLIKPNVNADADLWGDHWNQNADTLDTQLKQVSNKAGVVSFNGRNNVVSLTNADVVTVLPSSVTAPLMDGTASAGLATTWSKSDHVHPTDTSRYAATNPSGYQTAAQVTTALGPYAPLNSPVFTGDARAVTPSPGDSDTSIATTAFVAAAVSAGAAAGVASFNTRTGAVTLSNADVVAVLPASSTTPAMDGTAAVGTGTTWARADHVHPSDTTRAPIASPLFTGDPRSVTPPVGDADFSIATTAFVATAVAPAFNGVGRNLIHNPLFAVQQRTGPFTASGWGIDRWYCAAGGSTFSETAAALTDADRTAIGDEAARFCLQCVGTGTAGAGDYIIAGSQSIEDLRRLAGKTVTFSFWAKATAGTPKLGVAVYQDFGIGGSPSAVVKLTAQAITLSTTWTRYTTAWTLPSAAGKTFGSTVNTDSTRFQLWMSSGATNNTDAGGIGVQSYTLQLWGVQFEIGTVATPLEKPDPRYDLANCQRFYQIASFWLSGYCVAAGTYGYAIPLPVTLRASPTIVPTFTAQTNGTGGTVAANNTNSVIPYTTTTATGAVFIAGSATVSADL